MITACQLVYAAAVHPERDDFEALRDRVGELLRLRGEGTGSLADIARAVGVKRGPLAMPGRRHDAARKAMRAWLAAHDRPVLRGFVDAQLSVLRDLAGAPRDRVLGELLAVLGLAVQRREDEGWARPILTTLLVAVPSGLDMPGAYLDSEGRLFVGGVERFGRRAFPRCVRGSPAWSNEAGRCSTMLLRPVKLNFVDLFCARALTL